MKEEFDKLTRKNDIASQNKAQELLQEVIKMIDENVKTEKSLADLAHKWRNLIDTVSSEILIFSS